MNIAAGVSTPSESQNKSKFAKKQQPRRVITVNGRHPKILNLTIVPSVLSLPSTKTTK